MGTISAAYHGKLRDRYIKGIVDSLLSFPDFWLALLLILVLAEILGWLPTSGVGGLKYMLMPAITLSSANTQSGKGRANSNIGLFRSIFLTHITSDCKNKTLFYSALLNISRCYGVIPRTFGVNAIVVLSPAP